MKIQDRIRSLILTPPAFAILIISLVLLVRSLSGRNAYGILLSLAALALLLVLGLTGAWARRRLAALEPFWKIPAPLTASSDEPWSVSAQAAKLPLFFRLHFIARGFFYPQGASLGCPVFTEASLPRNGDTAALSISFPLGGLARLETSCRLRDIFGFFSIPCGVMRERSLKIRSAPCGARALRIDAKSGAEDRRNKSSSDEERYYMREYAPGDRFRDINWKSSGRIDTLITRISPENQEKITLIEVYFRNYGHGSSIDDFWLLDRSKARLAWFLRKVREEKDSYVFHVTCAGKSWELNSDTDIDAFLEDLAEIPFSPARNEEGAAFEKDGDLYVFSTACDAALPSFLLSRQGRPLSLFISQNAVKGQQGNADCDSLYLRDFLVLGIPSLARWLFARRKSQLRLSSSYMMIDYAETRL